MYSELTPSLKPAQIRHLRALAHPLRPLVHVGPEGATTELLAAVGQALHDHELIKVRMHTPTDKGALSTSLARGTVSTLCGVVGHTAILYRRHPERPKIAVPPANG